jgi:N-carbamoylputrescine amidase
MSRTVKVAMIQMNCKVYKDHNKNKEAVVKQALVQIKAAITQKANIICLPEYFSSIFFADSMDSKYLSLAEPIPGPTIEQIQKVAKQKKVVIIVPIWEEAMPGIYYNTACVIDVDGTILGLYRKNHLAQQDINHEKFYFKPGNLGYPVFRTRFADIGIMLGYDRYFSEAYRILALNGAEIVFIPTAEAEVEESSWEIPVVAGSMENSIFTCVINRTGKEDETEFMGNSFVVDPHGDIIAQAENKKNEVFTMDLEMNTITEARQKFPLLRDRRPETYGDLIELLP